MKTGKADGDLSRDFPNILPITRKTHIAGELPSKAYASVVYTDKKQLEFILDLTANTYCKFSTMEMKYVCHLNLLKNLIKLCKGRSNDNGK